MNDNDLLLDHARTGVTIPPGDYWVDGTLTLTDGGTLRGTPGGVTVLRPTARTDYAHIPVLNITSTFPSHVDRIYGGLPPRTLIQDLRIIGTGPTMGDYGIMIRGANIRIARVDITACTYGMALVWSVDTAVRDCLLSQNHYNVYIDGIITTTRFLGCNIREATADGIIVHQQKGLAFVDTIIEANAGSGLHNVVPGTSENTILLRDVWFEANGYSSWTDPYYLLKLEGLTATH